MPDEVIERNLSTLKAKKKALDKVVADYKDDLDQAILPPELARVADVADDLP